MRLTFFVSRMSPRGQAWAETLAVGAYAAFLAMVLHPALDYVQDQAFAQTPALGWSGSVRALAIPVGCAAGLMSCALRLARHDWRDIAGVISLIALIAFGCYLAAAPLTQMGQGALLVFFVGFLGAAVMGGVPIAFAFSLATSAYLLSITSTPLSVVVGRMDEGMSCLPCRCSCYSGILPAIVLSLVLGVVAWWRAGQDELAPESSQKPVRAPWSQVGRTFVIALPALLLPFLIRSAVVEGIATATEVSTIGIAYSLAIGLLIYRGGLTWKAMMPMLLQTAALSGAILFIVGAACAMGWALTQSGFSHDLAEMMTKVPGGAIGFLLVSIVAFIVLGSVLEGIPAIVLFGPLLFPVAHQLGINEVHYAMVVVLAMGLGVFAPPFGLGFVALRRER